MNISENKKSFFKTQRFFTLILIFVLISLSITSLDKIRDKVKDTKRKNDIRQIVVALETYYSIFNRYPESNSNDINGWETSYPKENSQNNFLNFLSKAAIMQNVPVDPINSHYFYYRYQKFPANSFGCKEPFYILQAMSFDGTQNEKGFGKCPEKDFLDDAPNGYTVQVFE